jgi:Papain-like cysteine protease AvrRpt2
VAQAWVRVNLKTMTPRRQQLSNSKAAKALGLSPVGFGQQITAFDFKQRLAWSPIWIAGEWFLSSLHARLVTGCSDDFVEYLDPWYGGTYGMDLDHRACSTTSSRAAAQTCAAPTPCLATCK